MEKKMKAIVDFGNLFHRLWHMSNGAPVDDTRAKVRDFAGRLRTDGRYEEVIIAIDAPPYKRNEKFAEYKANRVRTDDDLRVVLKASIEDLVNDGLSVAKCHGWEADDVIATLIKSHDPYTFEVYGTDKDLLQCTNLIVPFTNDVKSAEDTLGVTPEQVVDYLVLVGDSSDNIPGVKGVGQQTAKKMLDKYGSLFEILAAVNEASMDPEQKAFRPKTLDAFEEAIPFIDTAVELVKLNDSLEIEWVKPDETKTEVTAQVVEPETTNVETKATQHIVKHQDMDYRHSIEPIGVEQSYKAAVMLHKSGLWIRKFANPESVMATMMRGRAMGLSTIQSLDLIHFIQGQPVMSAQGLIATVKASPVCKYFMCTELTDESCTWETWRVGDPRESTRTFTRLQADRAGFTISRNGVKDNWQKQPDTMLQWRCGSALARQVYPDVTNGVYSEEEME